MLVEYLSKFFAKRLYFKLLIYGLLVQFISLFRNYPSDHPCGKVLEINSVMSVLINCDSAIYMKDAQNPIRLFNGESVYQDRPLPTLLVAFISKLWHILHLPDYYREFQGNSGQIFTYSLITYVNFLVLNIVIFSLTCWLGIKSLEHLRHSLKVSSEIFISTAFILVTLISMNEISKTFFWTPGSQVLNLLLPIYAFYLTICSYSNFTTKFYSCQILAVTILLFSYAFFVILLVPLLLIKWGKFTYKLFLCFVPIVAYLTYPFFIIQAGGVYNNFAVGYRRVYVWVIDAYQDDLLPGKISEFLFYFLKSIPMIPFICLLIALIYSILVPKYTKLDFRHELIIISVHIFLIAFYGYYSRRLTFPIIIILILVVIKLFLSLKIELQHKFLQIGLPVMLFITYGSWIFTSGPLV